jgi:thiamine biosynthesis lipoprotein
MIELRCDSVKGPALVLAFCCLLGCAEGTPPEHMAGEVFGTSWSLTYFDAPDGVSASTVRSEIESVFALINGSMNHYDVQSVIGQFNRLAADIPVEVDWDFAYVLTTALELGAKTGGAYDVTVSPLSDLWGFGPDGPRAMPSQEQIDEARSSVGTQLLEWDPPTRLLSKRRQGVKLDFSSLAKGYAIDLAADALQELDVPNFMLEVGGEVRVSGVSPRGDYWRIAVERPDPGSRGSVQAALAVTDTAIATSGDYRNYFEHEGRRYSHLIDPRSGFPIEHDVVSVTVVHGSAMMADAWATALTVLGGDTAMTLAREQDLAVYLLRRKDSGLVAESSPAMRQWLVDESGQTAH